MTTSAVYLWIAAFLILFWTGVARVLEVLAS